MLEEGDQIRDYTLKCFLGHGSYGQVWLAEKKIELADEGIPFALKFLSDQHNREVNAEIVRNEVRNWIKAGSHLNVVSVQDGFTHGRYLVIVSEYVDGGSLRHWLDSNNKRAPSVESAVQMMRGILRGLAHLHSRKIIHRDLKPENILLKEGFPKITDFGVSRVLETFSQSKPLHYTGGAGAPLYMPPEAFKRGNLAPQHDTWSAGVMLYEMLSGDYPFSGDSLPSLYSEILEQQPRLLAPDVPRELQEVIFSSLAKNVSHRFQTAEEMNKALEKAWTEFGERTKWRRTTIETEELREREREGGASEPNHKPLDDNEQHGLDEVRQRQREGGQSTRLRELEAGGQEEVIVNESAREEPNGIQLQEARRQRIKKLTWAGIVIVVLGMITGIIIKFSHRVSGSLPRAPSSDSASNQDPTTGATTADAYLARAKECAKKEDYDCAIDNYTQAIAMNPGNALAYNNRGNAFDDKGDFDQAINDYDKAIELSPEYADAFDNLGLAYYDKGDYDRAIQNYNVAIALSSRNVSAYCNRGNAYYAKGKRAQAMNDYNKATEIDPQYANPYNFRGLAFDDKGDHHLAIKEFTKAIELNPKYANAYFNRGNVKYDTGNIKEAITDYDKAIEFRPRYASAYNNRGNAYDSIGEVDTAMKDYDKAIELNPKYSVAFNNRGLNYSARGDSVQALKDYNKAVEFNPRYAMAYYNRALTYQRLGETEKAKADRRKYEELSRKK